MKRKPILKKTLEEIFQELKKIKEQNYQKIFQDLVSQNEMYQSLPAEEQADLIDKASLLALNVVSSTNCTLRKNNASKDSLKYLERIQQSDGTLETTRYVILIKENVIVDDQLSPKLIRILNNNEVTKRSGLSSFKALPDDIDNKPYKEHYLKFCTDATRKILGEVLTIARQKIEEDRADKENRDAKIPRKSVFWAEQVGSRAAEVDERKDATPPPAGGNDW